MSMSVEIWKDITGYNGLYQVSSMGRVRSIDREVITSNGNIMHYKGKMLKLRQKNGYSYALLCNKKEQTMRVHRLVAMAFIPTDNDSMQVNHKNGNKSDNRVENLEWCTASENQKHSYHTLNRKRSSAWKGIKGDKHPISKRVIDISNGMVYSSIKECALRNNINRRTLNNMLSGHRTNKTTFRYESDSSGIE